MEILAGAVAWAAPSRSAVVTRSAPGLLRGHRSAVQDSSMRRSAGPVKRRTLAESRGGRYRGPQSPDGGSGELGGRHDRATGLRPAVDPTPASLARDAGVRTAVRGHVAGRLCAIGAAGQQALGPGPDERSCADDGPG